MSVEFFPFLPCEELMFIDLKLEEMISTMSVQKQQKFAPMICSESSGVGHKRRELIQHQTDKNRERHILSCICNGDIL